MQINSNDQIQYWVNHLSFLLRREVQSRFASAGHKISAEEWAILLMLWQQDKRTPGELAAVTVKDQTTVTRLVDAMVRKELVTRSPDDKDRRKIRIALTARGRELQHALVPIASEFMADSQNGVSDADISTALCVLRQMALNVKEGKKR